MITDEMKLTEHYRMYAEVFGIDVPLTQSQPTEFLRKRIGTKRFRRSPNPDKEVAESSAPRRSTVIRLQFPKRRSTHLTPPASVPTVDKADEMILQDTLQMEDGQENIVDDSSIPRNDESNIPGTRIEPQSDKESPEVEIAKEKEVELTNVVIPVNVNDEDEEITDEVYELKRREKGKIKLQELTDTPYTTSSSSSPHKKLAKTNRLLSMFKTKLTRFKCYKSFFHELQGRYGCLFAHLRARFMPRKSFDTLADNCHDVMVETLHAMVDKHIKEQVMMQVPEQAQISTQIENAIANVIPSQVDASVRSYMSGHILHILQLQTTTSAIMVAALQMKFERNTVLQTACRTPAVRPRDQDDPHDDAHPEGENSAKRQKTSEYEAYVFGESSSGQVFQEEQAPSTLGNQE
ncbi:hypothetical protein Tco_0628245 [Tanacetum coccineum]|uniref:Uncharacterized protein n=1 Tax=Tanacetum coccineum TaxID=301880 RepID=A0ABQ4WPX7_9ASTR